jgi:methylated-DNA-[protein]-cysteine S-methyltransferase
MPSVCRQIEPELVATATGEAEPGAAGRVETHVQRCAPCRAEFQRYRALGRDVDALREAAVAGTRVALARAALESRLADLRRRVLRYRIFDSPLGRLLIARSEEGVSLVEYLGEGGDLRTSRLGRLDGVEAVEDGADLTAWHRELLEYLQHTRTHLEWPLDLSLARSEFQRRVLEATAAVPYGAVTSYAHIARELGKPAAVRAVAQALRWNPVPIVVPCHRVVGSTGALTGYAGDKIGLKERLLAVEHVPIRGTERASRVARDAMYVRDPGGREYCLPTCGALPAMTLARLTLFASREGAEASGLTPCGSCRPDLHPLDS